MQLNTCTRVKNIPHASEWEAEGTLLRASTFPDFTTTTTTWRMCNTNRKYDRAAATLITEIYFSRARPDKLINPSIGGSEAPKEVDTFFKNPDQDLTFQDYEILCRKKANENCSWLTAARYNRNSLITYVHTALVRMWYLCTCVTVVVWEWDESGVMSHASKPSTLLQCWTYMLAAIFYLLSPLRTIPTHSVL